VDAESMVGAGERVLQFPIVDVATAVAVDGLERAGFLTRGSTAESLNREGTRQAVQYQISFHWQN
jgi:hypothetical protein